MRISNKFDKVKAIFESGFIQEELYKGAKEIAVKAKAKAAEDKGDLKASIEEEKTILGAKVTTDDEASLPQEFGTKRHAAQPFLRPAFEENALKIAKRVEQSAKRKFKSL